jgi:AAA+ ATPase superfamily predicted ATPase
MNNYTNIYDVDGNIIRKAGDNHKFTLEEVEKLVDDLTEKVRQNPDNQVYKVYLNNAQKWLFNMYNNMSTEDLKQRISLLQNTIQDAKDDANELEQKNLEEINKIMDEFKAQYDEKPEKNEGDKEDIYTLHSGESETDETTAPE